MYVDICIILSLQIETLNDKLSVINNFPFKSNVEILEQKIDRKYVNTKLELS